MIKKEFYFPSADGKTTIHAVKWLPDGKVKAVLQVSHGVTEHMLRYEGFSKYFTEKGFVIVGNDHIGHGTSIAEGAEPMYFGPVGSWDWVVADMHTCKTIAKEEFPNVPYGMLGFSLGSFVVRSYLIHHPGEIDAAILIGTGHTLALQLVLAKWIANREADKVGEEHTSSAIKQLTFETYNKMFAPNRTEYDWLNSNEKVLDEYIADPLRGQYFSAGLFRELLSAMEFTGKKKELKKMNPDTPVFFASGTKDPVGDCGKGVLRAYRYFLEAGVKDVSMKMYPELRHDILREAGSDKIYNDICRWLKQRMFKNHYEDGMNGENS